MYDVSLTEIEGGPQVRSRPPHFGLSSDRVLTGSSMSSNTTGSTASTAIDGSTDSGYGSMTSSGTLNAHVELLRIECEELGFGGLPQTQSTLGKVSDMEILPSILDEDIGCSASQLAPPEADFMRSVAYPKPIVSGDVSASTERLPPLTIDDTDEVPTYMHSGRPCMDNETQKGFEFVTKAAELYSSSCISANSLVRILNINLMIPLQDVKRIQCQSSSSQPSIFFLTVVAFHHQIVPHILLVQSQPSPMAEKGNGALYVKQSVFFECYHAEVVMKPMISRKREFLTWVRESKHRSQRFQHAIF
jgi:hypothetical protein